MTINKKIKKTRVKLSEALRKSYHVDHQKIGLNFQNIDTLDRVATPFQSATTLLLSQNRLKQLKGIEQFKKLQNLSLSYNMIDDFVELEAIPSTVKILSLKGNPIAQHPNYRNLVIERLPHISSLDAKNITTQERKAIKKGYELQNKYLHTMTILETIHEHLYRENTRLCIKLELYRRAYGTHGVFRREEPPEEEAIMDRYRRGKYAVKLHPQQIAMPPTRDLEEGHEQTAAKKDKKSMMAGVNQGRVKEKTPAVAALPISPVDVMRIMSELVDMDYIDEIIEAPSIINVKPESFHDLMKGFGINLMKSINQRYLQFYDTNLLENTTLQTFHIYPSDTRYLGLLIEFLTEKVALLHELQENREYILQTNFYALSIPGIKMCKRAHLRENARQTWKHLQSQSPLSMHQSQQQANYRQQDQEASNLILQIQYWRQKAMQYHQRVNDLETRIPNTKKTPSPVKIDVQASPEVAPSLNYQETLKEFEKNQKAKARQARKVKEDEKQLRQRQKEKQKKDAKRIQERNKRAVKRTTTRKTQESEETPSTTRPILNQKASSSSAAPIAEPIPSKKPTPPVPRSQKVVTFEEPQFQNYMHPQSNRQGPSQQVAHTTQQQFSQQQNRQRNQDEQNRQQNQDGGNSHSTHSQQHSQHSQQYSPQQGHFQQEETFQKPQPVIPRFVPNPLLKEKSAPSTQALTAKFATIMERHQRELTNIDRKYVRSPSHYDRSRDRVTPKTLWLVYLKRYMEHAYKRAIVYGWLRVAKKRVSIRDRYRHAVHILRKVRRTIVLRQCMAQLKMYCVNKQLRRHQRKIRHDIHHSPVDRQTELAVQLRDNIREQAHLLQAIEKSYRPSSRHKSRKKNKN